MNSIVILRINLLPTDNVTPDNILGTEFSHDFTKLDNCIPVYNKVFYRIYRVSSKESQFQKCI